MLVWATLPSSRGEIKMNFEGTPPKPDPDPNPPGGGGGTPPPSPKNQ